MKDKGVWGDPESEGSSKQTLGADVHKVDIRLKREGNRAMDWESPNVIRNPSSKSASTGGMHKALPREVSQTDANRRWLVKEREKSAEGIVDTDTSQHR